MIHKTAIIDREARISENVLIGPYCIVGPKVKIGSNSNFEISIIIFANSNIVNAFPVPIFIKELVTLLVIANKLAITISCTKTKSRI